MWRRATSCVRRLARRVVRLVFASRIREETCEIVENLGLRNNLYYLREGVTTASTNLTATIKGNVLLPSTLQVCCRLTMRVNTIQQIA